MLAGTYLFVRFAARAPEAYRAQATATLLAVLVVFGANGLAVFWVIPATGLDITPFAFTVAGLLLAWGLFRLGLLDITPIPQETILECLSDGLLVTDKSQNVIFTNPIFDSMASLRPGSAVGNQVGDLMLHWPNIFQPYKYKMLTKTSIVSGSATAQIEVHAAPLIHSDLIIGEIYSVREISERREHDIFDEHLAKTGRQPPITIIVNAKDGKILDINSTFIAQMHFKREEVIGRTMLELGIWEIKTRAETMQAFYESSKLNDKLTNVFDKNRRNLTWLLSITPVNINGYALQVWNAKIKSNTGNL
jgi:PAS domain-containing protein